MVSRALGNFKLPIETFKTFFQRCSSETRRHIGVEVSDWVKSWQQSTLSWDAHLKRDGEAQAAFLSKYPQTRTASGGQSDGWSFPNIEEVYLTGFPWAAALHDFRAESLLTD